MSIPDIQLREYPQIPDKQFVSGASLLDYIKGMQYVTAKKLNAEDSIIKTLTKNKGKGQLTNSPKSGVMTLKRVATTPF